MANQTSPSQALARKTYIFLVCFLALLVLLIAFEFPKKTQPQAGTVAVVPDFNFATVNKISITSTSTSQRFDLSKQDNIWQVEIRGQNYPVADTIVQSFSDIFTQNQNGTVVSTNPENFASFGIVEPISTEIVMFDSFSKQILKLSTGKNGTAAGSEYIQVNDDQQVLLVPTSFRRTFLRDQNEYRIKKLFDIAENEQVKSITMTGPQNFSLTLDDKTWLLTDNAVELDQEKVNKLVTDITNLSFDSYLYDNVPSTGLDSSQASFANITVTLNTDEKQELWFGETANNEPPTRYILQKSSGYRGTMNDSQWQSIFMPEQNLIKAQPKAEI